MGKLYKLGRIRSYILILLFFISLLICKPVRNRVTVTVDNVFSQLTESVSEKTGITISYNSMSPSILSGLYLKGITVNDKNNQLIFSINKVKISFNLFKLLKKDSEDIISSLTVDGINVDVDSLIDIARTLLSSMEKKETDIELLQKILPENTKLKNLNLFYDKNDCEGLLNVSSIALKNDYKKQLVNLRFDSNVKLRIANINKTITCKLSSSGIVTQKFDNSQINLKISDLTDGNFHLGKLNLHLDYSDRKLQAQTIQSVTSFLIAADYDIDTQTLNAQVCSKDLSPLSLLTVNSKQMELKKLKNVSISTDTILKCNFFSKEVDFITDTGVYIPDELYKGGFSLNLSMFGDEKSCELTKFSVDGPGINASANLNYIYETQQLSGFAELPFLVLANNKSVSTEVYFDPLEKGFMAFSPQTFIGDKALTAIQMTLNPQSDSYDFTLEAYDYSHADETGPGVIQINGSYLIQSKYFQTNIGLNSLYLDSIAEFIQQVLEPELSEKADDIVTKLQPYMFSSDIYASTDLQSVSFNIPYVLVANTKKENQFLMLTLNGSDQNIQLNQMSLILGKYALEASATLDKNPGTDELFYTVDLNSSSIPYHFSGAVTPQLFTLTGDYGTDVEVEFKNTQKIEGFANFDNLPVGLINQSVIFSLNSEFQYDSENGPEIKLERFAVELNETDTTVSPRIDLSGNITKYGAQINSISYADLYSALEGTADLMLNINDSIFDSVGIILNLKNPVSEEGIFVDGGISNPEHLSFTKENFLNSIYMNLQVQLKSFGLNRLGFVQNDNNRITATLFSAGTLMHPYLSVSIEEASMMMATDFLHLNGNVVLEDRDLSVSDFYIKYKDIYLNDLQAAASLENPAMTATGNLHCELLAKTIDAPLSLQVTNAIIPEGKFLPDSFMVNLSASEFTGTMIKKPFPLSISAIYSDNIFNISSSDNCGLSGSYSTDGILQLSLDNKSFLKANLDGYVKYDEAVLQFYDFSADLAKLFDYINFDELILVNKGIFKADVTITGSMHDPDFNGSGVIEKPEFKLPMFTNQKLFSDDIPLTLLHEELACNDFIVSTKGGNRLNLAFKFFLNKWTINHIDGNVKTLKRELFPVKMNTPAFKLDSNVSLDLQLYYEKPVLELTGRIFGEDTVLSSSISSVSNLNGDNSDENAFKLRTDLDINLGTHASINFNPIIRCVFVPDTKINLKIDQIDYTYTIDGQIHLKSGDLAYLNRNFYIKSGNIKFNSENIANPLVTLNAETREKDDRGQTVKIILDVENQYLLDLNPRFSSIPAKSENEINSLLGQIVVADSSNAANFLFAASDYALQSTVVRSAENKLRELLNFDIFSIRTNVLQNTLNLGVSRNISTENLTIGNLLDNSTVYIGKYLGSSLYVDAMLHVSFEDRYVNDITSAGSLIFQPEIGMELESPFANIRVNMAPDINALLNNQFVPSTSVTLSWKFTF